MPQKTRSHVVTPSNPHAGVGLIAQLALRLGQAETAAYLPSGLSHGDTECCAHRLSVIKFIFHFVAEKYNLVILKCFDHSH